MADVTLLRSVTGPARKADRSRGTARNHSVTPRYASQTAHSFSSADLGRNVTILLLGARCYVTAPVTWHGAGLEIPLAMGRRPARLKAHPSAIGNMTLGGGGDPGNRCIGAYPPRPEASAINVQIL